MYPPIFEAVNVPAVQALLKSGSGPLRFWLFGRAPQNPEYPYAVWRVISGTPENYLATRADMDTSTLQVDVYVKPSVGQDAGGSQARQIAEALRDAIEPKAYITNFRGEERDTDTNNWHSGFDVDWKVPR